MDSGGLLPAGAAELFAIRYSLISFPSHPRMTSDAASIERVTRREVLVKRGDPLNLTCLVSPGNPGPENKLQITWLRMGARGGEEEVSPGRASSIEEDEGSLRISHLMIKEAEEEMFVCTSFNGIGGRDRKEVVVRVMQPPVIMNRNESVVAVDGNELQMEVRCRCSARPAASLSWFLKDRQITGREERYSITESVSNDVASSRLLIRDLSHQDVNSRYKCVAHNDLGRDQNEIVLRQKGKPAAPTNVRIVSSSWNFVHLIWDPGFDGGFAQWWLVRVNDQREVQVESNEIVLQGLSESREYQITIRSANSPFGESLDSQSLVVTTPEKEDSLPQLIGSARDSLSSLKHVLPYVLPCLVVIAFFSLFCLIKRRKEELTKNDPHGNDCGIKKRLDADKSHPDPPPASALMPINQSLPSIDHKVLNADISRNHQLDAECTKRLQHREGVGEDSPYPLNDSDMQFQQLPPDPRNVTGVTEEDGKEAPMKQSHCKIVTFHEPNVIGEEDNGAGFVIGGDHRILMHPRHASSYVPFENGCVILPPDVLIQPPAATAGTRPTAVSAGNGLSDPSYHQHQHLHARHHHHHHDDVNIF